MAVTIAIYIIQIKFDFKNFNLNKYIRLFEIVVRAFLATSNPRLPRSFYMRFVIGLWILGAVFITAHIQTTFIAGMTKPGIGHEIKTHKELFQSDLVKITGIV